MEWFLKGSEIRANGLMTDFLANWTFFKIVRTLVDPVKQSLYYRIGLFSLRWILSIVILTGKKSWYFLLQHFHCFSYADVDVNLVKRVFLCFIFLSTKLRQTDQKNTVRVNGCIVGWEGWFHRSAPFTESEAASSWTNCKNIRIWNKNIYETKYVQ